MVFKNQEDMPESCPPPEAVPNDVEPVYRFIENDTIGEIDFLNHKERNLKYPSKKSCEALALSFFTSTNAAEKVKRRFKRFKGKILVKGKITSDCGVHIIKNDHLNLWMYKNVNMLKVFLGEGDNGEIN